MEQFSRSYVASDIALRLETKLGKAMLVVQSRADFAFTCADRIELRHNSAYPQDFRSPPSAPMSILDNHPILECRTGFSPCFDHLGLHFIIDKWRSQPFTTT